MSGKRKYAIQLSQEERKQLKTVVKKGVSPAYTRRWAEILLLSDEGEFGPALKDADITERLGESSSTLKRVRQRVNDLGLETALKRKPREKGPIERVLSSGQEAQLIALACSETPEGVSKWSLRYLSKRMVELNYVEHISHETVRRVLKKHAQTLATQRMVYCAT